MTKNQKTEPTVTILGEDFSGSNSSLKSSEDMIWGTFLLFCGSVLLFNYLGVFPWEFWDQVWRFWPVIIVLSGLSIILGKSWLARLLIAVLSSIAFGFITLVGLKEVGIPLVESLPLELPSIIESLEAIIK